MDKRVAGKKCAKEAGLIDRTVAHCMLLGGEVLVARVHLVGIHLGVLLCLAAQRRSLRVSASLTDAGTASSA